jgi:hypothetical protein
VDDIDDVRDVEEFLSDLFVRASVGFDFVHVYVENRTDAALVIKNSFFIFSVVAAQESHPVLTGIVTKTRRFVLSWM